MNNPVWDGQRWRIRVMVEGKTHSFSCKEPGAKGRKEVIRKYNEWLYNEGSGEKTVGTVCKEYLSDLAARCGQKSAAYYQNECYIRCYILPECATRKMCRMTLRSWQDIINGASRASGEPLSAKTLKNLRGIIMGIIKYGFADYQCEPLRGELYIPQDRKKGEREILQKEDIKRLFEPSDLWYWPAFCFMVMTGLRPGECLGLQLDDIDDDCIHIKRAVNTRNIITEGKNKNARRVVPIGGTAKRILQETIQRNDDYRLRTRWIFCSPDGSQGNQRTMKNQWNRLKASRELPGTLYSLRHTFVSLVKNVLPEAAIKSYVGHSETMDTLGTYGHELTGERRQAAEVIDLTFKEFDQNLTERKLKKP